MFNIRFNIFTRSFIQRSGLVFCVLLWSVFLYMPGGGQAFADDGFKLQENAAFKSWLTARNTNWKNYEDLSDAEKAALKEKYERFESLPDQEKKKLRQQYQKLQQMSPQEKKRYQQLYKQLKRLPKDERQEIKRQLDNWDNLSPGEQQNILRKFRN